MTRQIRESKERGGSDLVDRAVVRVKEGDTSGLDFLYVRYGEDVRRYVESIVRDHHEAEDVTQSVFLKLMFVIKGYEPRGVPFCLLYTSPSPRDISGSRMPSSA